MENTLKEFGETVEGVKDKIPTKNYYSKDTGLNVEFPITVNSIDRKVRYNELNRAISEEDRANYFGKVIPIAEQDRILKNYKPSKKEEGAVSSFFSNAGKSFYNTSQDMLTAPYEWAIQKSAVLGTAIAEKVADFKGLPVKEGDKEQAVLETMESLNPDYEATKFKLSPQELWSAGWWGQGGGNITASLVLPIVSGTVPYTSLTFGMMADKDITKARLEKGDSLLRASTRGNLAGAGISASEMFHINKFAQKVFLPRVQRYVARFLTGSTVESVQQGIEDVAMGDADTRTPEQKKEAYISSIVFGGAGDVVGHIVRDYATKERQKSIKDKAKKEGMSETLATELAQTATVDETPNYDVVSKELKKEVNKRQDIRRGEVYDAFIDQGDSPEVAGAKANELVPSVEEVESEIIDDLKNGTFLSDEEKENLKKAYEDALQYGGDDAETYIVMKDEVQQQLLDAGYSEEEADMNSNALASLFMNSFEKAKKENPDLDFETAKEKFFDIESIKNYAQEENVAKENDEKLFSAAAAAMYPNPRSDIDSFYEFVKNNPNHKKSYMVFESKGGLPLDIVSDTIKHGENDHNLSVEEWRDVLDNIDNIEKATFSAKPTSYGNKAYLLKIKTPKRKYGISVAFNKGHNYVTTIFKTTDKGYEHWVNKTNKKTAVAPAPYPQVGSSSTQRGNVSYGLSVEEVINLLKSNVNKNDIRRSSKLLSKTIDTDNVYGATKDDGEPISNPQNFNAFIEGSKVSENDETVSPENPPKKLYRGDTRYFEEYQDQENAFEYNWGKGFYLSDSEEDVITNYQRGGADLNNRIEREAEQLSQEEDIDYDEAKERIRQQYEEGDIVRTFYVSMKEPVIVGGDKETFFEYNEEYDEETDEYGEPSGKGVELIGAIENYLYDIGAEDYVSSIIGELQSRMVDNSGLTASEVEDTVRGVEESNYLLDYGSTAGEMLSSAFASIGFDGIIDHRAGTKFKGMSMPSDTTHYVVFNSEQAKATDNKGEWGIENKNFYYSKKSEEVLGSYDEKTRMVELFKGQNPSTLMHELSHHFLLTHLKFMEELGLIKENAQVYDWLSRQSGRLIEQYSDLTRADKETLTEAFIEYVNRGVAPNIATQNIFQRAKKWVLDAYKIHRGKASKEIREYFDSLISKEGTIPNVEGLKLQTAEIKNILKSVKKGEAVTYRGVSKRDIKDLRKAIHTRVGRKGKSLREELIANGGIKKGTQLAKALSWDSRKEDKLFTDKKTAFDKEDALIDWLMSEGYILPYQDNESYDDTQNRWDEVADLIYNSEYVYKDEEQRLNESRETSLINQAHAQEIVDELLQDNELGLKSVSDLYYLLSSISSKADETDIVKVNKDALKYLDLRLKELDKDYKQILKIQENDFKEKAKEQLKNKSKELKEGFKEKTKELKKEAKQELNEAKKEARQQGKDLLKANEEIRKINEENEVASIERELARQTYIDFIRNQSLKGEDKVQFMEKVSEIDNFRNFISLVRRVKPQIERIIEKDKKWLMRNNIDHILRNSKPKERKKQKFNYEYNTFFEKLRGINKLSKEGASQKLEEIFDMVGEDAPFDDKDILINKFLSYKANGMDSSLELMKQLSDDLSVIYNEAIEDRIDTLERLSKEREEKINEVVDYIENTKAVGKINQKLLKMTNLNSNVSELFGKKWADEHKMDETLIKQDIETNKVLDETIRDGKDIYGLKTREELIKLMNEMRVPQDDYTLYNYRDDMSEKLSKMQLIDIYLTIKNKSSREAYRRLYEDYDELGNQTTTQIEDLLSNLTPEDKKFADELQKRVNDLYDAENKVYVKLYGIDMPKHENYWMRTSEKAERPLMDVKQFMNLEMLPSFMKERSKVPHVVPDDAFKKFARRIHDSKYMTEVFEDYKELYDLIHSNRVKKAIVKKYDNERYKALNQSLKRISLGGVDEGYNELNNMLGKAITNWVVSKISVSETVFIKQLASFTNYIENVPVPDFVKYETEFWANPEKAWKFMDDFAGDYLNHRFKSGIQNEVLHRIMTSKPEDYSKLTGVYQKYLNLITLPVRLGDIGAIKIGGYARARYLLDQGVSLEKARKMFIEETESSMQSGNKAELSEFQQNPLWRVFTAFKNTNLQYMRKMQDSYIQYTRGEISAQQFGKIWGNYMIVQSVLYQVLTNIGSWWRDDDDEDLNVFKDVWMRIFTAPLAGFPIIGDITEGVFAENYWGLNISGKQDMELFIGGARDVLDGELDAKKIAKGVVALTSFVRPLPDRLIKGVINLLEE